MRAHSRRLVAGITVLVLMGGLLSVAVASGTPRSLIQSQQARPYRVIVPGIAGDSAPGSTTPSPSPTSSLSPTPTISASPTGTTTPTGTITPTGTATPTGTVSPTVSPTIIIPEFSPPSAADDVYSVAEDGTLTVPAPGVLANDSGAPDPQATVETGPANGTLILNANGGFTYTPDPDFNGSDEFFYTASNGIPPTDVGKVSITVTAVDDAPVAVPDSASTDQDMAVAIDVLANDTDVDGGPKSVASVTDPANGVVVITGGGTGVTYTPDPGYCNTPPGTTLETFSYTLSPGDSAATVTVTVVCEIPPVAVDDAATVGEDAPATAIDVLANDTDVDGGPKFIASATQPANGTVVLTGGSPGAHTGLTYQPDPNYCNSVSGIDDTFTYTLTPGTSSATVSVVVTCVDDAPTAVDDSATVDEDSAASAIDVLANDTDPEADAITIASATQPGNGTVVLTGGSPGAHTGLTYEPDPNYCNSVIGIPDTFTYSLNPGGSTATVSVTVDCVDDDPTAVDDAAAIGEDDAATAIGVLANDLNADGGPILIASASDPANGTVVLTGGSPGAHTGLTYQPDADYCNNPPGTTPDTFTYTLTPGGSTATVSVTVDCADDAPVAIDDAANTTTDAAAFSIDVLANDTDIDGGPKTIASATDPANGTVVLTGGSPGAHTGLTYQPDAAFCDDIVPDTFTYSLNPGGDTATVSVTVLCDIPPIAANDTATVEEDAAATTIDVTGNDDDGGDGGPVVVDSVTQPTNGSVVITNAGADLTYQPNLNYCNTPPGTTLDTFTYTLNGGSTATVSVTVNCVDDDPGALDDAATLTEDDPATAIAVLANDTDVDGGPMAIASASDPANGTVVLTGGVPGEHTGLTYQPDLNYCNSVSGVPDTFTYTLTPGGDTATVSVTVTCVDEDPDAIDDTISILEDAAATTISVLANDLDPDSKGLAIASVTQPGNGAVAIAGDSLSLTYQPNADYCNDPPGTTLDTFTYTLTEGGDTATVSVTVTCVNDAPVVNLDVAGTLIYPEQNGLTNLFGPSATVTDIDSGSLDSLTVTISSGFDAAFDTLDLNTAGFTANFVAGTLTITKAGGTPAEFTTALRNVRFGNTDDDPDDRNDGTPNPTAADRTVSVVADDGPSTSSPVTRDITITPANDAPLAPTTLPTTTGIRNTTLVSGVTATEPSVTRTVDLISNSVDPDGLESAISVVAVADAATTASGRITLATDGDLRYEPPASITLASDTYGYQLTDGTTSSSAITLTVNLSGEVWYVADQASAPNDGTAARPFATLAAAIAAATSNDAIHIRRAPGDGTLTAGIALLAGQKLIGEGVALTNTDVGTGTVETLFAAGTKPTLTASGVDVVTLANSTVIAGLSINPDGAGGGLAGTNPTGVTVRTTDVTDTGAPATQPGIELTTGGGLTFSGTVSISTTTAQALSLTGTVLSGTLASTTVSAGPAGGVALTNTTGSLTFQALSITTSGGTGFLLANAASIDVDGTNFATTVSSTNGPAVDATTLANGSDLVFDSVTASGTTAKGVNLDGSGGWTFSAAAGAVSGSTSVGVDVNGGTGNVTYAGPITATAGRSVEVTSHTGGTVLFSGAINDSGTGINLNGNTSGTINFTGGVIASTGANAAFSATAGGTVSVTGATNTLATTTGTALNVTSTNIGAGGLTFRSISSNGAANGIVLSSTGSSGGLTVTGNGGTCTSAGTCTGGAIQNATGSANIALDNIGGGVSLTRTFIGGSANDGILGTTVVGLTLAEGIVTGNGNAVGDDGLDLTGLTGTVSLTNQTVTGSGDRNVDITHTSGTLSVTVTGSTISNTSAATGDDGLVVIGTGSGSITLNIQDSTFTDNKGDHVQMSTDADATVTESLTINGSTFSTSALIQGPGGYVLGGGITVNPGGSSTVVAAITGNNIQRATDEAIIIDTAGSNVSPQPVNFDVTITGNTIGTAGTTGSGSSTGTGIFVSSNGMAVVRATVSNNFIREYENGSGIHLVQNDGNGSLDATVQGNTITDPGTFALNGIRAEAGAATGDAGTLCVDIGHASTAALENDVDLGGLQVNVGEEDMRVRHRFNTTVLLPGYGGAQFSTTDVINYLIPRNDAGGVPTASAAVNSGFGGGFANGACSLPALP